MRLVDRLLRILAEPRSERGRPTDGRQARPDRRSAEGHTPTGMSDGIPSRAGRPASAEDFRGAVDLRYAPREDGRPDPGEVVWAWVPFEEDRSQGKDRPVLVIGRAGRDLVALMLTSQDHDRDQAQEARYGRRWLDIGAGDWDRQGRPSEVRLDRVLRVPASAVRREGAALDRATYDRVADAVRQTHGWPRTAT